MKEQQSQLIPIVLTMIAAVLGAFAQYFFKLGSLKLLEVFILKNYYLIAGLFSFFLVLVLILASFRLGGKMMVVYPCYGTTYIWGLFIAHYLDKELVNPLQITGIFIIIIGIGLVSYQR
jgi:drug/metabolite transporter (DMT)-like permease